MQFVAHLVQETMCSPSALAYAERTTFVAPARMDFSNSSLRVPPPVDRVVSDQVRKIVRRRDIVDRNQL